MVMMISSSEPFSKWLQCNLASSPLTSGEFAISLANIKGEHIIYAFGVIFCKESNGEVVIVCCATYEIQVCSPKPEPCKSFACNNISFSASEIVAPSMLPVLFHVFFKSSSPSQPPPCCHMCEAGFQLLLHLSLCQLHRHYSVSGIIALLSLFTVCLLCFDDHVMITCYLHLHKAQTKPSQRK